MQPPLPGAGMPVAVSIVRLTKPSSAHGFPPALSTA